MALLIALINIVGWGLIPLTVKGSPAHQIAGMGLGAFITAFIIYLCTRPAFDAQESPLLLMGSNPNLLC